MSKKFGTRINVDAAEGCFPMKANPTDAAYDLAVEKTTEIFPNTRQYVSLGFRIQLPSNMKMLIQPRSGQSGKGMIAHAKLPWWLGGNGYAKVRVNSDILLGLIDCKYGKVVQAIVKNDRWRLKHRIMRMLGFKFYLFDGDRICQGAFTYVPTVNLLAGEVTGERSGLGSTDI